MARAFIIINGYPAGEKFFHQAESIKSALEERGIQTDILKNGEVYALIQKQRGVTLSLKEKYAFAVYLDKDKYLGHMLESAGLRLFNSARAIELCDDKMTTYIALKDSGLSLAESIPAPLCYTQGAQPNMEFLQAVAKTLGFPLVAKKSYGSFGAGVQLVHGMPELKKIEEEWLYTPHFYQRYIQSSKGRDIRVIVIGGKALGGMERVAKGEEFRSNIELGGEGRKIELAPEYIAAAEQAAKTLGLDYCGVDLLETEEGPVLCEVNSNAFFEGFERVTGLQPAKVYAEYLDKYATI